MENHFYDTAMVVSRSCTFRDSRVLPSWVAPAKVVHGTSHSSLDIGHRAVPAAPRGPTLPDKGRHCKRWENTQASHLDLHNEGENLLSVTALNLTNSLLLSLSSVSSLHTQTAARSSPGAWRGSPDHGPLSKDSFGTSGLRQDRVTSRWAGLYYNVLRHNIIV